MGALVGGWGLGVGGQHLRDRLGKGHEVFVDGDMWEINGAMLAVCGVQVVGYGLATLTI